MGIRHYARSTESSYAEGVRRFLDYRAGAGAQGEPSSEDARAFLTRLAMVRGGKGDKDRTTLLPQSLHRDLRTQLDQIRTWHGEDLARGLGEAPLPGALARKYPKAAKEWGWQYVFPSDKVGVDPADGRVRRYHVHEKTLQAAVRRADYRAPPDGPART